MENSPKYRNANNFLPPSPRSYNNNCSTFVQADTSSFKQVVQILTGSSETAKHVSSASAHSIPPIKIVPNKKQSSSTFRLYERRNSMKNLKINPMKSGLSKPEILSPSILDFPSLVLSPVRPLGSDPFNRSGSLNQSEEDRGIKEKGFYLHPSPRNVDPKLLPLFPLTSPRFHELF